MSIKTPDGITFFYKGPSPELGMLPAVFYFALSAEQTLEMPPYNAPVAFFDTRCRIFSVTLPAHGESPMEHHAIKAWGEEIAKGSYILEEFMDLVVKAIYFLVEQNIVDPEAIAFAGLSRGALIATHMAAKIKEARFLLGFAPLTFLNDLEEYQIYKEHTHVQLRLDRLNLLSLTEKLSHLHGLRFYIGNRDTKVGTDNCYHFIRKVAEKGYEKKARHFHIELYITQSIGHKGHGTAPSTFQEGSSWLKQHLLKE